MWQIWVLSYLSSLYIYLYICILRFYMTKLIYSLVWIIRCFVMNAYQISNFFSLFVLFFSFSFFFWSIVPNFNNIYVNDFVRCKKRERYGGKKIVFLEWPRVLSIYCYICVYSIFEGRNYHNSAEYVYKEITSFLS